MIKVKWLELNLFLKNEIISVSRNGSFSHWSNSEIRSCFSGHYNSVNSIEWIFPNLFISVGNDKVARGERIS